MVYPSVDAMSFNVGIEVTFKLKKKGGKIDMMASILDYPARKVFVKDLTKCVRLQTQGVENVGKKKQKEWKIECNGVEFIATVVWMQGLVTEVCDHFMKV